ncbi:hypothetical protein [Pseudomonas putida]|uniref:hypothetical protein n=1 Tax=Pseudomonas putida TaxID=303 RepID=UPI0012DB6ED6|nr:hypothetical protein [Pseudomonas putida]
MSPKALDQWDCNDGDSVRPDGLPPGWCIQTADDGVSMWMDKRYMILKYKSIHPGEHLFKRVTVERNLGNGRTDTYSFIIEERKDHTVTWLAGTDTGTIRITQVERAPSQGPLDAASKLEIHGDPATGGRLQIIENHGIAPAYVTMDVFRPGIQTPEFAAIVISNSQSRKFYDSFGEKLTFKWRGAEWIRTDLYAPWPPT